MAVHTTDTRSELIQRFLSLRAGMDRRFGDDLHKDLAEELGNVTFHQLSVLSQLRDGPLAMRELSKRVGVSESAATSTADRLVRQGLVERRSDPNDRRIVRLELCAEGVKVVDSMERHTTNKLKAMLSALSDTQLAQLVEIFETIANDEGTGAER